MSHDLHGSAGAAGVAIGAAIRLAALTPAAHVALDLTAAQQQLAAAQQRATQRFSDLAARLRAEGLGEQAGIFDAHALIAADTFLAELISEQVQAGVPLDQAIAQTIEEQARVLEQLEDAYQRERAADIRAVGKALRTALHHDAIAAPELPDGAIVLAEDLTPAETYELPVERIAGFATASGGPTGHTIILARALGLPAVVGLGAQILTIADQTTLILDGDNALLTIEPHEAQLAAAQMRIAAQASRRAEYQSQINLPGATADGVRVALWANLGRPVEARAALAAGAEGVGLFRTEFMFLERATPPSEEEQYQAYRELLSLMGQRSVVVRTLDIGADKPLPYLAQPAEANPFLGVRGLRLCQRHPELFQTQLRALLRAAVYGDLWIMLPMVATLGEFDWARQQLQLAMATLDAQGLARRADPPLGVMIETPAAAMIADLLARQAAFFSIGSNDLTQYTLAADRGAHVLGQQYSPNDPAVLRLIERAASAAQAAGIPIGVCGEMAADPELAVVLVGLGVGELSMSPAAIPAVKARLAQTSLAQARALARKMAQLS